jgi:hypothetical protein
MEAMEEVYGRNAKLIKWKLDTIKYFAQSKNKKTYYFSPFFRFQPSVMA